MRTFFTLVILGALGYGGYWYFTDDSTEVDANGDGAASKTGEVIGDTESEDVDTTANVAPEPPPPPSEEDRLRKAAEGDGAEGHEARYQLARLLLAKKDAAVAGEATRLLTKVFQEKGEHSTRAAAILLQMRGGDEGDIRFASHIYEKGPKAPAFGQACLRMAREELTKREESAKVRGWELLSQAYYSSTDPKWRDPLRKELDDIAKYLIFSKRFSTACTIYTIQAGDTLGKIAKKHGTTVDNVRALNNIDGDIIHPGKRLKILQGEIIIEVKKSDFRLDALIDGKYLFSTRVGLGVDGCTPVGEFEIDLKQKKPDWQPVGREKVPYGSKENPLGERWLGFKNTEQYQGFGIHGTNEPETIGTECSNGCVRMTNEDVIKLYGFVPLGTKVMIRE